MTKLIIGGFSVVLILMVVVLVALFTGINVKNDEEGHADVSIFWGLIKVNEKTKQVSVMGDLVKVDGLNQKVSVAGRVNVDGVKQTVDINQGDIIVDGIKGLTKVRRGIVVEIKEDKVLLDPHFQEELLKSPLNLKISADKNIELKGKVIGTDEVYLHLQTEKSNLEVKVEL